ncbi:hypothetical protein DPMN_031198 [Dreissena polymorpha]|uniref:Uncharacterized protein n=1 Tax=Dreissena polymorpha TaxID=45954 RepID=A0A9D4M2L7_DREPO|nr:hypothetical protein DPMN_031198 [Dreissena polymorpha]
MSNISLGGNHGHSINFDGASLQNQQEDEYRKEEEQQQNEVCTLVKFIFFTRFTLSSYITVDMHQRAVTCI